MNREIKILQLEDLASDAELVERELRKAGMDFKILLVDDKEEFINALEDFNPDIVLSDHALPSFNSIEALKVVKRSGKKIPFILVTATVSEEFAVDVIVKGADDYILKDRLQRLPSAIQNCLEKYSLEREKQRFLDEIVANEGLMKDAERLAHFGSWQIDLQDKKIKWSNETYRILGFESDSIIPSRENFLKNIYPEDKPAINQLFENFGKTDSRKIEFRVINSDGTIKHIVSELTVQKDDKNRPVFITGFMQDVTENKEYEESLKKVSSDLLEHNISLEQFAYIVSHNLRAPVANIIGTSSLLQMPELDENEKEIMIKGLHSSVKQLDEIVRDLNNILQVRQEISERKEKVILQDLLNEVKVDLARLIEHESAGITSCFDEVGEIFTLRSYLHSIFFNLISNSIMYCRPGVLPVIGIKSKKENNKIILYFSDNGMGMDLGKEKNQIFGFYKKSHPHTKGKGMGLFMVKIQTEVLGGRIKINSEVNKGTEIIIEFDTH